MNVKPAPFGIITIKLRPAPTEPREGRTKYRMSCKRISGGSSRIKRGVHTLRQAKALIDAWRKNGNATPEVCVEYLAGDELMLLQTDADWAYAILKA